MKKKLVLFVSLFAILGSMFAGLAQAQVDSTGVTPLSGVVRLASSASCNAGFVLSGGSCVSIASISSDDHFTLVNGVQRVGDYELIVSNLTPTTADIQYRIPSDREIHGGPWNSTYHTSGVYHIQIGVATSFNEDLARTFRGRNWSGILAKPSSFIFDGVNFSGAKIAEGTISDIRAQLIGVESLALAGALGAAVAGCYDLDYKGVRIYTAPICN